VVDVVFHRLRIVLQNKHMLKHQDEIVERESLAGKILLLERLIEALVKAEAAHARKVIALLAKN